MEKKQTIQEYCRQFRMSGMSEVLDQALREAETGTVSYLDYTIRLLQAEAVHRERKDAQRRFKTARLPKTSDLDVYDYSFENGLPKSRLTQLRELDWLDQIYNIILMGPSGTGKLSLPQAFVPMLYEKDTKPILEQWTILSVCLK
jgi:DNA replication protein DnaC